jgi:hypothetical protein
MAISYRSDATMVITEVMDRYTAKRPKSSGLNSLVMIGVERIPTICANREPLPMRKMPFSMGFLDIIEYIPSHKL